MSYRIKPYLTFLCSDLQVHALPCHLAKHLPHVPRLALQQHCLALDDVEVALHHDALAQRCLLLEVRFELLEVDLVAFLRRAAGGEGVCGRTVRVNGRQAVRERLRGEEED